MKLSLLLFFFIFLGCNSEDDETSNSTDGNIVLQINGLESMTGQHYEGWVIAGGEPISTGRFNINDQSQVVAVDITGTETTVIGDQGQDLSFNYQANGSPEESFVLTIEPDNDADPLPSEVHYLGGAFTGDTAEASIEHSTAIQTGFATAAGTYILATPTTASDSADDNQGIWFLNAGEASLTLPPLPSGWRYEGWIVDTAQGTPITTGIFSTAEGADSDGAGPEAGPDGAPPFPGQDFITPPRVLNDGNHTVVISVEPYPDFDPAPFTLKILNYDIKNGDTAGTATNHPLTNFTNESSLSITATLN